MSQRRLSSGTVEMEGGGGVGLWFTPNDLKEIGFFNLFFLLYFQT